MSSFVKKFVLAVLALAIIASSIGTVSAYTYNRQAAADYAKVNWNTNVPGSWYFQERGGDCTNFVSQSLYVGGWPQRGTEWTPNYRWYFNSVYSYSSSWTSVPEFRNFIINSGRGTEVSLDSRGFNSVLQIGDVVMMDGAASVNTNPDGVWDHNMIIVAKSNNELFVAYHTKNTQLRSVTEMRTSFSKAKFTAFHLANSGAY